MCETCEYRERAERAERRAALAVNHDKGVMLDLADAEARATRAEAALRRIASMSPTAGDAGWCAAVDIASAALTPTEEGKGD